MASSKNWTRQRRVSVHLSLAAALLLLFAGGARAQSDLGPSFEDSESQGVSFHRYIRPGDVPVQVEVLGHVRSPGLYEVSMETDVSRLLALAGGLSEGLRSSDETVRLEVNLYRRNGDRQDLVYTVPMDSLFVAGQSHPRLQDGDVVNVSGTVKRSFNWRDSLRIATSAASLALFVERLIRIMG